MKFFLTGHLHTDFKRGLEKLRNHFHSSTGKKLHKDAVEEAPAFVSVANLTLTEMNNNI